MSEQGYSFDVFVSSGDADLPLARATVSILRRAGLKVWHQDDIASSKLSDHNYYVTDALKRSRAMVQLLSQSTVQSGWQALEERTYSFRDPSNRDRQFVLLGIHSVELPASIAQSPVIDWSEENRTVNTARLIAICRPPPEKPTARGLTIPRSVAEKTYKIQLKLVSCSKILPIINTVVFGTHDGRIYTAPLDFPNEKKFVKLTHSSPVTALDTDEQLRQLYSASLDRRIKVYDLATGEEKGEIPDPGGQVTALCIKGETIVGGLKDGHVKIWQSINDHVPQTLKGHTGQINAIECRGSNVVTASADSTLRIWNITTGQCTRVLEGHTGSVTCLAISPDGHYLASGSSDQTVKIWDLSTGQDLKWLDSHTDTVRSCVWKDGGRFLLTAGGDRLPRIWDIESGKLLRILDGNTSEVLTAVFDQDSVWASDAQKICKWNVSTEVSAKGSDGSHISAAAPSEQVQYTNAKVLLVGDSGAGKTGLSKRLACGEWEPSAASTIGAWATQWALPANDMEHGDREIWLWDFGGQADQRLIHQLYMDETALAVLVFDAQRPNVFDALAQWDQDLRRSDTGIARLLVAGRIDASPIRVSRQDIDAYVVEKGFRGYHETSALTNHGCNELRNAIIAAIDWEKIPWRSSPALFKSLKEEIVRLKDEGRILMRRNELRDTLRLRLPATLINFSDAQLRAVLGLLSGPGVVTELEFGGWVLFQPELINAYGQAVISTMRQDPSEMGCVSETRVLSADLEFGNFKRIPHDEERFVLLEMHRKLLQRGLCAREFAGNEALLVFPSYYKRNRPALTGHPAVIVSYQFEGVVDEIYATLAVRLDHTKIFKRDKLWQDAAEFTTNSKHRIGIKLSRSNSVTSPLIEIYCEPATLLSDKILFTRCVHEHLQMRANGVVRRRHYVCTECTQPVADLNAAEKRLKLNKKDIGCAVCDNRIPLLDELELQFSSPETIRNARRLEELATEELDNESKERALVGEVISAVALAQQLSREKNVSDHGIDMEIEFKDEKGRATGQLVFLQLKSGDSYLRKASDGKEYFQIKNQRHVDYWLNQVAPVMLVIRNSNGEIRWMEVKKYLAEQLKRYSRVTQIEFNGENFNTTSIMKLRQQMLSSSSFKKH